jgi:hypothetical protein
MSTVDKHSIKEHHEEITDDNNREMKNIDEIPVDKVLVRIKIFRCVN